MTKEKLLEEMYENDNHGCTEIVVILDRSGSMNSITDDAIGSFNAFLAEQQKLKGKALLTLILFDDKYDIVHNGIDIQDIKPLDKNTYVPRGMTALLDAIGKTINSVRERINNMPEDQRPEKVLVGILTDGHENASHEYNRNAIMKLIDEKDEGWEFLYLAANQDAIREGSSIGIGMNNCHTIIGDGNTFANGIGAASGAACFYAAASNYRAMGDTNFDSGQTEAFVNRYNESKTGEKEDEN